MASHVGPLLSLKVQSAPASWNEPSVTDENELCFLCSQGVGWSVYAASPRLKERVVSGEIADLFVADMMGEGTRTLYVFETLWERALYFELLKLNKVGPKTAATFLVKLGLSGIGKLLVPAGLAALSSMKISGLGPKTLQEMEHGLGKRREAILALIAAAGRSQGHAVTSEIAGTASTLSTPSSGSMQLISSLEKLGLPSGETQKILDSMMGEGLDLGSLPMATLVQKVFQRWGQIQSARSTVKSPTEGRV